MQEGFVLTGILGGNKRVIKKDYNTKVEVTKYQYLLVIGVDSYLITSDVDYSGKIMFGDMVSFRVTPNVYNDKLYLRGDLVSEE